MNTVIIINTFVISIIIIPWWVGEHWVPFFHLHQNQESNQTSSQCILVPWCSPGPLYECCIYIQINEPYECCDYQRVMKTSGGAFWNYMNVAISKAWWSFQRCILKPYDLQSPESDADAFCAGSAGPFSTCCNKHSDELQSWHNHPESSTVSMLLGSMIVQACSNTWLHLWVMWKRIVALDFLCHWYLSSTWLSWSSLATDILTI